MHVGKIVTIVPPLEYMTLQLKLEFCIYFCISFEEPFDISQFNSTNGTA